MLLNSRMDAAALPSDHSASKMETIREIFKKQAKSPFSTFQSHATLADIRYFNMRTMQRLHRYRSIRRQWPEISASLQNNSPPCIQYDSPSISPNTLPPISETTKCSNTFAPRSGLEPKPYCINDYINATGVAKDNSKKHSPDLDPPQTSIPHDLITLRKLIKVKQRRFNDNSPNKMRINAPLIVEPTPVDVIIDDKENNSGTIARKLLPLNKLKPLDHVRISGSQWRHSILSKRESPENGLVTTSNASSTCSQYSKHQQPTPPSLPPLFPSSNLHDRQQQQTKQQTSRKAFRIQRSRLNYSPSQLPADSLIHRASQLSVKKPKTSCKTMPTLFSKQLISSDETTSTSSQVLPSIEQRQSSFIKSEALLPFVEGLSDSEETLTAIYTYAASTTSKHPHSTMIKRNSSLLPIILQSSSCIGQQTKRTQQKRTPSESEEEQDKITDFFDDTTDDDEDDNNNNTYYHLLDYKHLINRLPEPVVTIQASHGQDDYGILFEQLDHIRETMPGSNIYSDYARNA